MNIDIIKKIFLTFMVIGNLIGLLTRFNYKSLKFDNPWEGLFYVVTLIISIILFVKFFAKKMIFQSKRL